MRKVNSQFVKIVKYKAGRDKKGFAYAAAQTYTPYQLNPHRKVIPAHDKNKYVSKITFIDKKLNVKVSCSCPDYVFGGWEWSNAQHGASDIIFGNGEPPDEKNPSHHPGLCKHLIHLREYVKKKHGI